MVARPLAFSAVGHGAGWKSGWPGSDEPHPGQRVLAAVRKAWLDTSGAGDGRTGNSSNVVVARPGSAKPRTHFSDALAGWPRRDASPVERRDLPVSEGRPTGIVFARNGPAPKTGPQAQFGCAILSILREAVFEPCPRPHADLGKHGVFAVSTPPAGARILRRIRLSRTRSALPRLWPAYFLFQPAATFPSSRLQAPRADEGLG